MTAVERVIATATAEIGYLEKATNANLDSKTANAGSNNWTKYARDLDLLGVYNGKKNGYAWCDMFVDWCFITTFGLNTAWAMTYQAMKGLGAGCTYSAKYYKDHGRFDKNPKPGDQIFFTNDGGKTMYHTGLVVKVDSTYVYTIEGNTSSAAGVVPNGGCTRDKKYKKTASYIGGYGHPNYDLVPGEITANTTVVKGTDNEKYIWDALHAAGFNTYGIAGLMGNLYAESGLIPTNMQNSYEKKLGYTDATYTAAVDSGKYTNFAKDGAGYGLAQWTYPTRKQALLDFAKSKGKSVGDLGVQVEFLIKELATSFKSLNSLLRNAVSVKEASDAVITQFERPANQSAEALNKRASYGEGYFAKYVKEDDDIMSDKQLTEWFLRYRKTLRDNDCSEYSKEAREWVANEKIMAGGGALPDGTPNMMWEDLITREQTAVVLFRYNQNISKKLDAICTKLGITV